MPRDYERSKPLPMHMNITPESASHYVRRALHIIEPQVLPVAKALTWAITESRVAVGAAVELLVRDADFELVQFQRKMGIAGLESVQVLEPAESDDE